MKKGFFGRHFALILWHGCHRQKYDEVQTQCINFILEALKNGGCFFSFFCGGMGWGMLQDDWGFGRWVVELYID